MQYRIFSIPASGAPDLEEELNLFLRSHRIIAVQKSIATVDSAARWCFCVEYLADVASMERGKGGQRSSERIDYKTVLSEEDFALFARLRELRKHLAATEAIPVYAVCTNEHLGAMSRIRPVTLSQLKTIEGLGEAKASKYGESFINMIKEASRINEAGKPSD